MCVCVYRALGSGEVGKEQGKSNQVAFPDFIQHASHLLRGSLVQRSQRLHLLCNGQVSAMKEALHGLLSAVLAKLSSHLGTDPGVWPSPDDSVLAVSDHLITRLAGSDKKGSVLPEDIEAWLAASPIACRTFDVAFALCLYSEVLRHDQVPEEVSSLLGLASEEEDEDGVKRLVTERLLFPLRTQHPLLRETFTSSLLTKATLLVLNSYFPVELRGQLYPLFSSLHHGESYSTLCKALVGRGPTLLVVRDQKGYVFGGFAADSWQFGPQFTGLYKYTTCAVTCYMYVLVTLCYICILVSLSCAVPLSKCYRCYRIVQAYRCVALWYCYTTLQSLQYCYASTIHAIELHCHTIHLHCQMVQVPHNHDTSHAVYLHRMWIIYDPA